MPMENLLVPYIPSEPLVLAIREELPMRDISCLNWPAFPHRPSVRACLAHDGASLWIYYKVHDLSLRAEVTETNGPVYTDSCVEIFISPRGDEFYYNLEFNAIGTILCGYGRGRERRNLDPDILSLIETFPSLGKSPLPSIDREIFWDLLVRIPAGLFIHENIPGFNGLRARGNISKCGDLTAHRHYLTLWPVETVRPDFHRHEFFGEILFERQSAFI